MAHGHRTGDSSNEDKPIVQMGKDFILTPPADSSVEVSDVSLKAKQSAFPSRSHKDSSTSKTRKGSSIEQHCRKDKVYKKTYKDKLENYYDEVEAVWKMDDFFSARNFPVVPSNDIQNDNILTKNARGKAAKQVAATSNESSYEDSGSVFFLSVFSCSGTLGLDRNITESNLDNSYLKLNEERCLPDANCSASLLDEASSSPSLTCQMIEQEIRRLLGSCNGQILDEGSFTPWQIMFQRKCGVWESPSCMGSDAIDIRRWSIPSCTDAVDLSKSLVFCNYGRTSDERSISSDDSIGLKKSIRNRAFNFTSRKSKIRTMEKTFRPLQSLSERDDVLPYLKYDDFLSDCNWSAQSFDDKRVRLSRKLRSGKRLTRGTTKGRSNICPFVSGFDVSVDLDENHPAQLKEEEEVDLCYDSDPTDLALPVDSPMKNRQLACKVKTTAHIGSDKIVRKTQDPFIKLNDEISLALPPAHDESLFDDLSSEKILSDPSLVDRLIEDTINTHRILIWHANPNSQKSKNVKPVHVKALIEMGSILKQRLIYPKFAWRKVNVSNGDQYLSKKISPEAPHFIELLHICRVLPVNDVDRSRYPYARRNRCFLVGDLTDAELFEACSTKERDRIVQGLKLTVARLGAMTFFNSESVFDSFFTPYGSVPGEAPF